MRSLPLIAAGVGIAAIAVLVGYFGTGAVVHALVTIGLAGFAAVCLIHLVLMAAMGLAWRALLPGTRWWVPIWGRFVRDFGVGGAAAVAGRRLCHRRPCALAARHPGDAGGGDDDRRRDPRIRRPGRLHRARAGIARQLKPDSQAAVPLAIGLGIGVLAAFAFLAMQRRAIPLIDRIAGTLGQGWAERTASGAAALHEALTATYRNRAGLTASFLLHLVCWIVSAAEIWVMLRFAGAPLPFAATLVIESLLYAARTAAFAIPNAVGVQEGAYILFGAAFGLSPETALALSLMKRARDLVIGLPTVAVWQIVEGGRLWRRKRKPDRDFAGTRAPE